MSEPQRIALCLSGGGLRATFFHLGVIAALRERGLLSRVTEIFSVSGGSIAAAHLVKHWDLYNSRNADEYDKACASLMGVARRDIRGRVVRRWLLGMATLTRPLKLVGLRAPPGRIELLEGQYEAIFGNITVLDLWPPGAARPDLHILTTNFNTGQLCCFSRTSEGAFYGVEMAGREVQIAASRVTVPLAVAASSAFPPLFPPARLEKGWFSNAAWSKLPFDMVYHTDGGVFDNLGFQKLLFRLDAGKPPPCLAVVSDASGAFSWESRSNYGDIASRTVRSTDILMRRSAEQTMEEMERRKDLRSIKVPIGMTVRSQLLDATTQEEVANVRTDLDRFSDAEVCLLRNHGRNVAHTVLDAEGVAGSGRWQPDLYSWPLGSPSPGDVVGAAKRLRYGFFDPWDPVSYVNLAYSLALIMIVAFLIQQRVQTIASEATVVERAEKTEAVNTKDAVAVRVAEQNAQLVRESDRVAELERKLAEATRSPPPKPPQVPPEPDKKAYKVWLQFAGFVRDDMKGLANAAKEAGWTVPGGDRGGERTSGAAGLSEIRYSPRAPADKAAAERLAQDLANSRLLPRALTPRPVDLIPPGSLEIWVGL